MIDLVEIVGGALVVDAEAGQAVDLVAPEVDADRRVGRRGEHVDDRAAPGEFATVFDELLASVAELDELAAERIGVDRAATEGCRPHDDRLGRRRAGAELLQQRSDAGDDHGGGAFGVAQAPEDVEPLAHRLDAGADAFERQRLPAGEVHDLAGWQELREVVGELSGHRAGRAADHQWLARRQRGECGDRDRPCHFDHRESCARIPECPGEPRLVAQQRRQLAERRRRCTPVLAHHPTPPPKNASICAPGATNEADVG